MTTEKLAQIRSVLFGLLPHAYIRHIDKKTRDYFIKLLEQYQKNGRVEIPVEQSRFNSIISVQGFGYSGSGAVLDFLREYPIEVLGFIDTLQGSKADAKESLTEIEILRLAGGFFEAEKYLDSENIFLNTAMLNRMVRLFQASALFGYSEEIRLYMIAFFDSLLDFSMLDLSLTYYNPYLTRYDDRSSIFFLKKHTLQEFRSKCKNLLNIIFNRIESSKTMLAVDQLCSDYEMNFDRNKEYFDNLKTILVTRDPRDLYVWTMQINCEWIAHDTVESFIKWYEITYKHVDYEAQSDECLIVRYEDLIWDYENTARKIENYLGLNSTDHRFKKQCFDPEISSKYTKLYKKYPKYAKDVKLIEDRLKRYCSESID